MTTENYIRSLYENNINDYFVFEYLITNNIFHEYNQVDFFERIIKNCDQWDIKEDDITCEFLDQTIVKFNLNIIFKMNSDFWFEILMAHQECFLGLPELIDALSLMNTSISSLEDIKLHLNLTNESFVLNNSINLN